MWSDSPQRHAVREIWKPRCTLRNGIPSESFQPVENRGIRAPRCRPIRSEIGRPCLLDRLSFHLQINGGIAIRSRSEERRVGKECRSGWWASDGKKEEGDREGGRTSGVLT